MSLLLLSLLFWYHNDDDEDDDGVDASAMPFEKKVIKKWIKLLLRSWVQIPPGPSFPVRELRH
jgi:hypothetical protein